MSWSRQVRLRRASVADAAALTEIASQAYGSYLVRMNQAPAPMQADYAAIIERHEVWLAEDDEQVLAMLVLACESTALQVDNVAVRPSAQRRGIGRQLLDLAERRCAELGYQQLTLYTNEVMTENLRLYRRLGYHETGRAEQDGYRRVFLAKTLP